MSKTIFSTKELEEKFLRDFNTPYMKYFGKNTIPKKMQNNTLKNYMESMTLVSNTENRCSVEELTKVYEIVDKVYGDKIEAEKDVKIYQLVSEKFIREFVGIEGLDSLYKPLFFVFEWLMHLEYNVEQNSYSYYRDHFIHQVRNMMEMIMLLTNDELDLKGQCVRAIKKGNSHLAIRIRKAVEEVKQNPSGLDEIKNIADRIRVPREEKDKKKIRELYIEDSIYTYILLASAIVTSVIHDIGYPVEFINGNLNRMGKFLPASQFFFEKKDSTFEMHRVLQDSMLYQTICADKVAEKIHKGDHGAISACTLLMKYYENGRIFSMAPVHRIIIELSALTIFEHTLRYEFLMDNSDKEADKYQISFAENPFSYLFRLCDDLEEWDRTYFEITNQSNFLLCEKCGGIINRWKICKDGDRAKKERIYACGCGKQGVNKNIFRYRKLTSINTCQNVGVKVIENNKKKIYEISIDYDLLALLQASAYSATFAKKRAEALGAIKKMTFCQNGTYPMYIDSFISNNPILIKTEMTDRFFEKIGGKWKEDIIKESQVKKTDEEIFDYIWCDRTYDNHLKKLPLRKSSHLYEVQKENLLLYMKLGVLCEFLRQKRTVPKADELMIQKYYQMVMKKDTISTRALKLLLEDCIKQRVYAVRLEDYLNNQWTKEEQYYDMYIPSKEITMACESYISGLLYGFVRVRIGKDKKLKDELFYRGIHLDACHYDFYSDYGVFQEMYIKLCNTIRMS